MTENNNMEEYNISGANNANSVQRRESSSNFLWGVVLSDDYKQNHKKFENNINTCSDRINNNFKFNIRKERDSTVIKNFFGLTLRIKNE